jgi:hypothetical protein
MLCARVIALGDAFLEQDLIPLHVQGSIYLPHGIVSFMYCAQDSCIYYFYLFFHIHNL